MKLKKMRLEFIIIFILLISSVNALISVSPSIWEPQLFAGESDSKTFTFTSDANISLAFTKTGANVDWLNLSASTLPLNASSSVTLTATIRVPAIATSNSYVMKMKYDSSEIPIILTVKDDEDNITSIGKCRLDPFPDSFTLPIVSNAPPITQQFSVLVTKHCTEDVSIRTPVIVGNTQTAEGLRPLNLVGGTDLGVKEPNEEGTFSVQIDSTNLPTGTYEPQIQIIGIYKGEKLTTKILFKVIVSQGATPLEGVTSLPNYIFSSSDLLLNTSYTITAQNTNPNFEHRIEPNEYLFGEKVDVSNGWVYFFRPTKLGKTIIRVYTYFKGAQIGSVTEKEVRISASSPTAFGTRMRFDFFPPAGKSLDSLNNGDIVNFLVKAIDNENDTGSVVSNAEVYKNGAKLESNSFAINAGEKITLTASAPGFLSVEKVFEVPIKDVVISITPLDTEIDTPFKIATIPENAVLTFNGELISNDYTPKLLGNFQLIANADGYRTTTSTITITPKLSYGELPKKIKIGKEFVLEFNKNIPWSIVYTEKNGTAPVIFTQADSNLMNFVPDRKGFYDVYLRNQLIKTYDLTGFSINWYWVLGIVGILLILYVIIRRSGSSGGGVMRTGKEKFEFSIPGSMGESFD